MAAAKRPVFDFSLCVSCSICVLACPVSCIELTEKRGGADNNLYPAVSDGCIGCGSCAHSCPMSAVSMEERA